MKQFVRCVTCILFGICLGAIGSAYSINSKKHTDEVVRAAPACPEITEAEELIETDEFDYSDISSFDPALALRDAVYEPQEEWRRQGMAHYLLARSMYPEQGQTLPVSITCMLSICKVEVMGWSSATQLQFNTEYAIADLNKLVTKCLIVAVR